MLIAQANVLIEDGQSMCSQKGDYSLEGDFCQALVKESWAARHRANVFAAHNNGDSVGRFLSDWGPTLGAVGCIAISGGTATILCATALTAVNAAQLARDYKKLAGADRGVSVTLIGADISCTVSGTLLKVKRLVERACASLVTGADAGVKLSARDKTSTIYITYGKIPWTHR
jgi:hypothetical protein